MTYVSVAFTGLLKAILAAEQQELVTDLVQAHCEAPARRCR